MHYPSYESVEENYDRKRTQHHKGETPIVIEKKCADRNERYAHLNDLSDLVYDKILNDILTRF